MFLFFNRAELHQQPGQRGKVTGGATNLLLLKPS